MGSTFLFLVDAPEHAHACGALASTIAARCASVLGFTPRTDVAVLDGAYLRGAPAVAAQSALERAVDAAVEDGCDEIYLLPATLDLDLFRRQRLVEATRRSQRLHPHAQLYYDDADPCHPLLVHAFVDSAARALQALQGVQPQRLGLLLAAVGIGDASTRAQSYRLMRLLWEQIGCLRGDVGFVRHEKVALPVQLELCEASGLAWVVLPQFLWESETLAFARVIVGDFTRKRSFALGLAEPIGNHPNVTAWLEQRALSLFRARRTKDAARTPSARYRGTRSSRICGPSGSTALGELRNGIPGELRYAGGIIADLRDPWDLWPLLERSGFSALSAERVFVKVTWHGYATGTYTDRVALDALLSALPGRVVLLEGHTTSRNRGGADWDWERDSERRRDWIRKEERDFLERTGLDEVMRRHRASYLNVTESFWNDECAPPDEVEAILHAKGVRLGHRELLGYIPRLLLEHRGAPLLSFARFKGPTRLSISNLFGLLPMPLRSAWHGPNISYFAAVCSDLAKLYGALFDLHGLVESLSCAVRWDRKGLYRSRWGNYDLVEAPGLVTLASDVVTADALAARLQGQDVTQSAFFDVVRSQLGLAPRLAREPIDPELIRRLA